MKAPFPSSQLLVTSLTVISYEPQRTCAWYNKGFSGYTDICKATHCEFVDVAERSKAPASGAGLLRKARVRTSPSTAYESDPDNFLRSCFKMSTFDSFPMI